MNTSKNSYVIIYMIVIVVIVSLLLSITSGVLHSRQADNVRLDTKKQILMSLSTFGNDQENKIYTDDDAAASYEKFVVGYQMLDVEGNVVDTLRPVEDFDVKADESKYPLYIAEVDGATKYIIPLKGAGLWGAIRAYLALDEDRNTIYGVYFGHDGETPGLGANIVLPRFRAQFVGKHILRDGVFASIAVEKKGKDAKGKDRVDAVSGGTITSKGVEAMFLSSLSNYAKWLTAPAIIKEGAADASLNAILSDMAVGDSAAVETTDVELNEGGNK